MIEVRNNYRSCKGKTKQAMELSDYFVRIRMLMEGVTLMLRRRHLLGGIAVIVSFIVPLHAQDGITWKDPSPHVVRFVPVGPGVRLEVLDWGGSGKAVILLAGGGDTAHVFDEFAPKLTAHNHVYGITRRGFGDSGFAEPINVGDRLGNDVLAVIDALKLDKPILVGHSIAGAELSWMANAHPDRIAGVVYLEAGYSYAFDDGRGSSALEMMKLKAPEPPPPTAADLVNFKALQRYEDRTDGFKFPEGELREERETKPNGTVGDFRDQPGGAMLMKLLSEGQKYTRIAVPSLFIFANPHSLGPWVDSCTNPSVRSDAKAYYRALGAMTERQEKSVQTGVPAAEVINIPHGNHFVFLSNETECSRAVQAFISKLSG
jgi:pimeloyl-ACP methyl ester carboxylesterase